MTLTASPEAVRQLWPPSRLMGNYSPEELLSLQRKLGAVYALDAERIVRAWLWERLGSAPVTHKETGEAHVIVCIGSWPTITWEELCAALGVTP